MFKITGRDALPEYTSTFVPRIAYMVFLYPPYLKLEMLPAIKNAPKEPTKVRRDFWLAIEDRD